MPNYEVVFIAEPNKKSEIHEYKDVDMAGNQLGWLVFADAATRQPKAMINPSQVKYVIQTEPSVADTLRLVTSIMDS